MKRCATAFALFLLASTLYAANPSSATPPSPQYVGEPCADNEETCGYPFGLPTDPGGDGTGSSWSCQACIYWDSNGLLQCKALAMYQSAQNPTSYTGRQKCWVEEAPGHPHTCYTDGAQCTGYTRFGSSYAPPDDPLSALAMEQQTQEIVVAMVKGKTASLQEIGVLLRNSGNDWTSTFYRNQEMVLLYFDKTGHLMTPGQHVNN